MFCDFCKWNFIRCLSLAILIGFCSSFAWSTESESIVPLKKDAWVTLTYSKIPSNDVAFVNNTLIVKVKHSAGPIVHKLEKTSKVSEFFVKGKITGAKIEESSPFDEDSVLRFGLVAIGKQTLTGPKKWIAADWVKKLFALAPEGTGLDKIYFFNLTNRDDLLNRSRTHPKSDLIVESIVAKTNKDGSFDVRKKIETPIEITAIWISIDGDDTKSEYVTEISEIKIKVAQ